MPRPPKYLYVPRAHYEGEYPNLHWIGHVKRHVVHKRGKRLYVHPWFCDVAQLPSITYDEMIYRFRGSLFDELEFKQVGERQKREQCDTITHRNGRWKVESRWPEYLTERQLRNRWDKVYEERADARKTHESLHARQHQTWKLRETHANSGDIFEYVLSQSWCGGDTLLKPDQHEAALSCLAQLGLDDTATDADIELAYKRLRISSHPDHGGAGFREVRSAFLKLTGQEVLEVA